MIGRILMLERIANLPERMMEKNDMSPEFPE